MPHVLRDLLSDTKNTTKVRIRITESKRVRRNESPLAAVGLLPKNSPFCLNAF
jgi:hypothetical protein